MMKVAIKRATYQKRNIENSFKQATGILPI